MAELDDAVRVLSALLKDVGGTETPGAVVVQPGENALVEALGLVKPGVAAVSSGAVSSREGSFARSVLGVLGSNLLEGSVAGQIASAVSGGAQKESSPLSAVLGFLGKGFGIAPAISAIFRLFGGGGEDEPVELPKYVAPPALHLEAVNSAGAGTGLGLDAVRYGAGGLPGTTAIPSLTLRAQGDSVTADGATAIPALRARGDSVTADGATAIPALRARGDSVTADGATAIPALRAREQGVPPERSQTQVVVQVNAMDSRSCMDHSDDIARAVREAILNMHPLTDAVSEL
jgi:hypothetical protein